MLIINNIFTQEEIDYIFSFKEINENLSKLKNISFDSVLFKINVKQSIIDKINFQLKTNITDTNLPMRWLKGNTPPHIDKVDIKADYSYLIYLTDSKGSFVIQQKHYPITKNTAFKFDEKLKHYTINTGNQPRLFFGPMNKFGHSINNVL